MKHILNKTIELVVDGVYRVYEKTHSGIGSITCASDTYVLRRDSIKIAPKYDHEIHISIPIKPTVPSPHINPDQYSIIEYVFKPLHPDNDLRVKSHKILVFENSEDTIVELHNMLDSNYASTLEALDRIVYDIISLEEIARSLEALNSNDSDSTHSTAYDNFPDHIKAEFN